MKFLNICKGIHKKCVNSWSRGWEGSEFSQIKVCFYFPWVGWGPGGVSRILWVFFHNLAIFHGPAIPFTCILECTIVQHVIISKKKPFHSNYGFIILIFSGIFRPFQRSKLELPQINRKLNFDQFRALNFQNRTNGSKVMVIFQL